MPPDKVSLCDNDFLLQTNGEETQFTAIAPVIADKPQLILDGDYREWPARRWKVIMRKARSFGIPRLVEELRRLRDTTIEERILGEPPVFNDDDENQGPRAVHTLELHHSRKRNYVTVRGTATHQHAKKLEGLGLEWNPRDGEWRTDFSPDILERIWEFIKKSDHTYDPQEIGYAKCPNCGRWKPEEKQCRCHSGARL